MPVHSSTFRGNVLLLWGACLVLAVTVVGVLIPVTIASVRRLDAYNTRYMSHYQWIRRGGLLYVLCMVPLLYMGFVMRSEVSVLMAAAIFLFFIIESIWGFIDALASRPHHIPSDRSIA